MLRILRISNKSLNKSHYRTLFSGKFVLGIETSCDETGAAVVDEYGTILGQSLASQMKVHLL